MQEVLTTFVNYQLVLDVSLYIPACERAYTRHANSARVHVQYMLVGGCHCGSLHALSFFAAFCCSYFRVVSAK
jgi:hypothetical protein